MPRRTANKQVLFRFWFSMFALLALAGTLVYFWFRAGEVRATAQALAEGQTVYQSDCAGRHEAAGLPLATKPTKLDGLFRHKTLPTGEPATDEEVRKVILNGRGIMPPFRDTLDAEQVNALIEYLHTK